MIDRKLLDDKMHRNHVSGVGIVHIADVVVAWIDVYLEVHRLHDFGVPVGWCLEDVVHGHPRIDQDRLTHYW